MWSERNSEKTLIIKQGIKGVPIGGFLSAQLTEIWATWREVPCLFGDSREITETAINESIEKWGREQGGGRPLPTLALTGNTGFTLAPLEAQTMSYHEGMMRGKSIANVTFDDLCSAGFVGWWSPVKKLVACLE